MHEAHDAPAPSCPERSLKRELASGLLAAAFLGALWGALESAGRILYYYGRDQSGIRDLPPATGLDWTAAIVLSGFEYALVGALLGLAGSLVFAPLLRLVLPRRDAHWRAFVAPRFLVIAVAVFFNLFWFSRFAIPFAYSERFYSPKRLLLALAWAVVAFGAACVLVRFLLRRPRLSARLRVASLAVVLLIGGGFLVRERVLLAAQPSLADAKGRYNVVLFVVDTLRADHLGCYGYPRPTSPKLDRLAASSTVFENAFVQAPYTWTSFGSLFSGKYPRKHGLLKMDASLRFSPKRNVTLQRVLDDHGYRTAAFLTGTLSNESGLIHGFETYFESMVGRDVVHRRSTWSFFRSELVLRRLMNKVRQAFDPTLVADEAVDWIVDNGGARFFTLVHLYSTHTPYDPPQAFDVFSPDYRGKLDRFTHDHAKAIESGAWKPDEADVKRIGDLYDGGVLFADAMIDGVCEVLARRGLLEQTIVVVTADHGEELGEHGVWEHNWMYNTNQRVPLIMRVPGGKPRRVKVPVESVDVLPTLLDLLGIAAPPVEESEKIDGESLVPWLRGESPKDDDYAFCENIDYLSVQDLRCKLIQPRVPSKDDPPRLYDLASDPGETVNLFGRGVACEAEMLERWRAFDASMPSTFRADARPWNSEMASILSQGGYTSGSSQKEGVLARQRDEEARRRAEQKDAPKEPPAGDH